MDKIHKGFKIGEVTVTLEYSDGYYLWVTNNGEVGEYHPKRIEYIKQNKLRYFRWKVLQYMFWHYPKLQNFIRTKLYTYLHDTGVDITQVENEKHTVYKI